MRVAVLGMGKMGHAVAGRLQQAGHDLCVWNRSPGKADDLASAGATEASSPAKAAADAEVVITSLADDAAVEAVVDGEGGLRGALREGAVYVDMSTVSPETAEAISKTLSGRSLASPILGAPQAVTDGKALYLVSGPEAHFHTVKEIYEALAEKSDQVRYLGGDVAAALRLKLLGNYLLLSGIAILSEVVATGRAAGVPEEGLRMFLGESPLVAEGLANRLDALFSGDHSGWFTTALGAKDVRLAEAMGSRAGLRLPIAELVKRRYEEAADTGHGDEDLTAIVELFKVPG